MGTYQLRLWNPTAFEITFLMSNTVTTADGTAINDVKIHLGVFLHARSANMVLPWHNLLAGNVNAGHLCDFIESCPTQPMVCLGVKSNDRGYPRPWTRIVFSDFVICFSFGLATFAPMEREIQLLTVALPASIA
jgi:hypothetical protein